MKPIKKECKPLEIPESTKLLKTTDDWKGQTEPYNESQIESSDQKKVFSSELQAASHQDKLEKKNLCSRPRWLDLLEDLLKSTRK